MMRENYQRKTVVNTKPGSSRRISRRSTESSLCSTEHRMHECHKLHLAKCSRIITSASCRYCQTECDCAAAGPQHRTDSRDLDISPSGRFRPADIYPSPGCQCL